MSEFSTLLSNQVKLAGKLYDKSESLKKLDQDIRRTRQAKANQSAGNTSGETAPDEDT